MKSVRAIPERLRLRRQVEEHGHEIDAGDAVDQGVVGLRDQRETVVLEAFYQPHLPQRLGAVELLGEDPRHETLQLRPRPGRGQGRVAHVILEVEARVVDPHRPPAVECREGELLPVARHQVKTLADLFEEVLHRRSRTFDDREPAHMHVRAGALLVQEGGVHRREPVEVALGHERLG